MSWLEKIMPSQMRTETAEKKAVPEGLWTKCKDCAAVLYRAELERSMQVCPKCSAHQPRLPPLQPRYRIRGSVPEIGKPRGPHRVSDFRQPAE